MFFSPLCAVVPANAKTASENNLERPKGPQKEESMPRIILASQSPRRKQLLSQIGIKNFEILVPGGDHRCAYRSGAPVALRLFTPGV